MTKITDITNQQFGSWTAIDFSHREKNITFWNCRCEICGDIHKVRLGNLKSGKSKKCSNCGNTKHKDITGQTFGNWTVIEYLKNSRYLCRCSCGNEVNVFRGHLKSNASTKCNKCARKNINSIDITGQKFGRLTALELIGKTKTQSNIWKCVCDCGNIKNVTCGILNAGTTKSCGCLQIESRRNSFNGGKYISGMEIAGIIHGAKSRNIECVDRAELIILIENEFEKQQFKCNLSGVNINFNIRGDDGNLIKDSYTASVDRIDSSKGYIKNNIQIVHKYINMMKWILDNEDFKNWCKLVHEHGNKI